MASSPTPRTAHRFKGVIGYFLLLIPATVLAFITSYSAGLTFSGLSVTAIVHIHTAMMALWLVMLVAQAWLASAGRIALHRRIGRASYVIAPLIALSLVVVYHELLTRRTVPFSTFDLQVDVYNWGMMIGFPLTWALAIYHRKRTPVHMRYIVSTTFVIASPITFRLLLNWLAWLPGLDAFDNIVIANGALLAAPLAWLIMRDHKQGLKPSPYWVAMTLILMIHVGYFTFGASAAWSALVHGFATLPLS